MEFKCFCRNYSTYFLSVFCFSVRWSSVGFKLIHYICHIDVDVNVHMLTFVQKSLSVLCAIKMTVM